jgi:hypothetical protein
MTFFYNLNKKLDEIRATPSKTHGQLNEHSVSAAEPNSKLAQALNERDMSRAAKGYEKYGKQGMQALAKAGREGKALDPVRAKYDKYDESQLNELSPELLKRARDKAGMKYAQADDRRDQKASDKYNRQDDKFNSALRKKQKDMDEGSIQGGVWTATPPKPGQPNVPAPTDPEGVPASKMTPTPKPAPVSKMPSVDTMGNATGISKSSALPPATKDVNKARVMPLPEQGNSPMTPKQKSFAKLAPPANKITFADKIAGAKKEVDEMLGDVAAEAIKGALTGGKKQVTGEGDFGPMEASTGDYSAKKARAGKDIGKPGKNFAKIEKSAGGGEKGKRIAGAVLNKLRHKGEMEEGWDDMERDVKSRMSARRVGDVTHGDKHDTQEIPGGRRVTRRVDPNTGYSVGADSDASADGEKRGRGRPKGADKGPERVTGKATKHKGGRKTNEGDLEITDRGEYDQEGDMAKDSIKTVVRHAQALEKILGDNDNLPEWVQSKLAKIESMMTAVDDYMQNQEDDEMTMGEEKTSTRDNRAEKAGKKVTKDIEYDEKKKDGIHGKKRGSEDARAEKAGKKVAKDIEYDEKKKKKTEEAGGTSTPTASSGFSFGQGIYDSVNRELEEMIAESMNVSMSSNSDGANGPTKSLTVTATDEDASYLAQILKSAGLRGGNEGGCGCGTSPCSCGSEAEHVDENSPDWPTNTETSHDALQYSGGLNKPKSTGQTTIPVIAGQDERTKGYGDGFDEVYEDDLTRLRKIAGIKEAKKEVEEEKTDEGNKFAFNVLKAKQAGKKEADLDGDGDMEKVKESILDIKHLWSEYKG